MKASGESMTGCGIHSGDLMVVDRSIEAKQGDVIIACINNDYTVKRLGQQGNAPALLPENPAFKPIPIGENDNASIFGVVTFVIHPMR